MTCVMRHFQIQIYCNPFAILHLASGTWTNKSRNFQNNCKQMKQTQITNESNKGLNQPTITIVIIFWMRWWCWWRKSICYPNGIFVVLLSVSLFIHFGFACNILFFKWKAKENSTFSISLALFANENQIFEKGDEKVMFGRFHFVLFSFIGLCKNKCNNNRITHARLWNIFLYRNLFTAYCLLLTGYLRHS